MNSEEVRRGYALGFSYTPLNGKIPVLSGWSERPRLPLDECLAWHGNLGVRTGKASGVVVVDVDPGGTVPDTRTWTVSTPRGGRHLYFKCPDPAPRNSASKIAPHVDLRGEGGQVVAPGSDGYSWVVSPDECPLAEFPEWGYPKPLATYDPRANTYALAALDRECAAVRDSKPGARRDTLNKAAYSLGGLGLDPAVVAAALRAAAPVAPDFTDKEIEKTIADGIRDGMANPRVVARPPPAVRSGDRSVLTPGSHTTDRGEYIEVGTDDFAAAVHRLLPPDTLYTFCGQVGEIVGKRFVPTDAHRMRLLIDEHMRLTAWKPNKATGEQQIHFRTTTRDLGELALRLTDKLPNISVIVDYPVVLPDMTISRPGFNNGVYCTSDMKITPETEPAIQREVLRDLVVDFPFLDEPSRQNYFGLLLTPLLRHAIESNTPMHAVTSSIERTGKTKLAETILGGVVMGTPTLPIQLGGTEEEREKRIMSILLAGQTIVHLDNVNDFLDSPALASLLTARRFSGRVLGSSRIVEADNRLTIVATGNNLKASSETVKRTVPIQLLPATGNPEDRDDFKHPHLERYVAENRALVLSCLIGMIQAWLDAGQPVGRARLGGFEGWAATIQGVLANAGFTRWGENIRTWRDSADEDGADLARLVELWAAAHGTAAVPVQAIADLADQNDVLMHRMRQTTPRGRATAMGGLLRRWERRVVGRYRIERVSTRLWSLSNVL